MSNGTDDALVVDRQALRPLVDALAPLGEVVTVLIEVSQTLHTIAYELEQIKQRLA